MRVREVFCESIQVLLEATLVIPTLFSAHLIYCVFSILEPFIESSTQTHATAVDGLHHRCYVEVGSGESLGTIVASGM